MTANLHFEDAFTSIFTTVANSFNNMKKDVVKTSGVSRSNKLLALGAVVLGAATSASAAVTVDFSDAKTDLGTVFAAIIGVGVLIYGYRKIKSMIGA